jgi:tRNA-specific 2-thiouridylase
MRRVFRITCPQYSKVSVVAMSGGVDSAVTACLLKKQGKNVHGVFMRNWDESDEVGQQVCTSTQDWLDVQKICNHLDIPCTRIEFIKDYWINVFQQVIDGYSKGITPNPDVLCNKFVKFDSMLKYCRERFDMEELATGHYARIGPDHALLRAKDLWKDQSYFLSFVNSEQLRDVVFPLGEYTKTEVREIAKNAGIHVNSKKDSTGMCFIGKRNFKDFIGDYITLTPGNVYTENGTLIGLHKGVQLYTIGERMPISGLKDKVYIYDKNLGDNSLHVCTGTNNPRLFTSEFSVNDAHWVKNAPNDEEILHVKVLSVNEKIHRAKLKNINPITGIRTYEFLDEKVRSVNSGQVAAFYRNNEICLGGAIIQ